MEDLRAFGFAQGSYQNVCSRCGNFFMGDKRATRCNACAEVMCAEYVKDGDRVGILTRQLEAAVEGLKWYAVPLVTVPKDISEIQSVIDNHDHWKEVMLKDYPNKATNTLAKIKKIGDGNDVQ